jgi:hypothetical protein
MHFDINGSTNNECINSTTTGNNGKDQTSIGGHEIEAALKKLKSSKARGKDNLPAEFLKCGGERLKQRLKHFLIYMGQ